jgi:type VI secretion system secreted protein Hcp
MALDMFLNLGASIKGESIDGDAKHKGTIDVLAWSWGMSNSGTTHMGSGGGSGKANFQDISITKYIDKASCPLMAACASGEHIETATLTVRKAGGTPVEYFVITLTNLIVSSYSTGGSGGEDRLTENVSLNFAKAAIEYKIQDTKGLGKADGNFTWDIAGNIK